MNYDQITGVVRSIAPALVAYFVARGYVSETAAADIISALIAVSAAVWSILNNRSGKVIK